MYCKTKSGFLNKINNELIFIICSLHLKKRSVSIFQLMQVLPHQYVTRFKCIDISLYSDVNVLTNLFLGGKKRGEI